MWSRRAGSSLRDVRPLLLLPFVLVAALQFPATARDLETFTCFDGQVGTVSISERGVSGVSSYPMCDFSAEADGVCLFSFCQLSPGCLNGCERCPKPRRVRAGHLKWDRRAGRVLVCEPPQFCGTDADSIQPFDSSLRNRCVGTVEPGIFGRCQRDPTCP